MKYTFFLALIFVICFLSACKKNFILTDADVARTTTTFPKLLKMTILDSISPTRLDSTKVYTYTYDDQSRIAETYRLVRQNNRDTVFYEHLKYFYIGNDILAYKIFTTSNYTYTNGIRYNNDEFFEAYYTYANNKRIMDSTIHKSNTTTYFNEVNRYNYTGANKLIIIHKYHNSTSGYQYDTSFNTLNKINDNIISTYDSILEENPGIQTKYSILKSNFTNTNVLSPFYNILNNTLPIGLNRNFMFNFDENTNKNLASYYVEQEQGFVKNSLGTGFIPAPGDPYKVNADFTYQLRADGYPISNKINSTTSYYPILLTPVNTTYRTSYIYE